MEKEAFSLSSTGKNVGRGARDEAEFVALGRRPSTRRSGNFSPSLSISLFSRFLSTPSPPDYTQTHNTYIHIPPPHTHIHTPLVLGVGTSLDSARTSLESLTLFHAYICAGVSSSRCSLFLFLSIVFLPFISLFLSRFSSSWQIARSRSIISVSLSLSLSLNTDRKVGRWGLGARLVRSPCLPRNWGKMKLTEQSDPPSLSLSHRSPSRAVGELRDSCGQSLSGQFNELQLGLPTCPTTR